MIGRVDLHEGHDSKNCSYRKECGTGCGGFLKRDLELEGKVSRIGWRVNAKRME
jgi:hypothetical protein